MSTRTLGKLFAVAVAGITSMQAAIAEDDIDYRGWNAAITGGVQFYEGDEEVEHTQRYGVRAGYDLDNRWTVEGDLAYLPYINNEHRELGPGATTFELDDETWGLRFATDLLYHLNEDPAAAFDPFAAVTGGISYYGDDLENDQQWDPFGGFGAGATYYLTRGFGLRGDYRIVVAGHDTEWNQSAVFSATYSWGRRAKAVAAAQGEASDDAFDGKRNENLKSIYFAFDSSELTPQAKQTLKENADYLGKNPGTKIMLEGHCDERGTDEYNLALGERRSRSAFEFLRSLGVTRERMSTVTYGESRPADPAHTEEAWAKNRRVECLELPK